MSGFEIQGGNDWAIREHSLTGNTHVGHLLQQGNSLDVSGNANQSTFIGIYDEQGDQVQSTGNPKTLAVGGHAANKIPSGERVGPGSRLTFSDTSGSTTVTVSVPDVAPQAAISLGYSGESGTWGLKRWPTPNNAYKWGIEHSPSGIRALEWSEDASAVALNMSLAASECAEILACQP
jgi:hypothetical protein